MAHPVLPLIQTFRRPAVIAAIVLLLVNDHLLKVYAPSWLTGKLSDFAGLFFFPLLRGALIELAAARLKRKAPLALPFALAATALLFAAIKTLPAANAFYTSTLGVQVVRDPSDLLSLVMLFPAWWLGKHQTGYAKRTPGRTAYAVLALGALASMATQPCMPGPAIERVISEQGNLYVGIIRFPSGTYSTQYLDIFQYTGEGDWQPVVQPEPVISDRFAVPPPALPYMFCDPANPQVCYQIDGTARVEESTDGGQTWRNAWSISPERKPFMNRMPQVHSMYCGKVPELRTADLAMLPGGLVVVAAGNEGLVVRDVSGAWQRVGIEDYARPTSIYAQSFAEALQGTQSEFIYAGTLSLLAYTILSIWARRAMPRPGWALHPGWFVLPLLLAGFAMYYTVLEHNVPRGGIALTPLIFFAAEIALGLMLLVMGLLVLAEPEGARRRAGTWAFVAVFSPLIVTMLVFLLWAYGVIQPYWLAAVLAVILTAVGLVLSMGRWRVAA